MNNATRSPFLPGLVSITFRRLLPEEVIALVVKADLRGIEWGGDIHVPHGQIGAAREVGRRTRDSGLSVAAYGSYYRVGVASSDPFPLIVDTAVALGAKIVRVWPGNTGSAQTDDASRARVVDDARHIAELAAAAGLTIACEWHGGTLTDTAASAEALLAAVDHPAFNTYWQPRTKTPAANCLIDMKAALPRLAGLHVYCWDEHSGERRPLADGESDWRKYLQLARTSTGIAERYAMIEFVRNDEPSQFLLDAVVLKQLLES